MEKKILQRLERVFKGVANSKRIGILIYIAENDNTTLWQISQNIHYDFRLTSHHTAKLEKAGLIKKQYAGARVIHYLTPYGEQIYKFLKTLE